VTVEPLQKRVSVHVSKTFGTDTLVLKKLLIEPAGRPTDQHRQISLSPFKVLSGNTLDLSQYYDIIMNVKEEPKVLHAPEVP